MTNAQFSALAELLRLRSGPARECARLVLVDGLSVPDAARQHGISYPLAYKAAKRARDGLALAQAASGGLGAASRASDHRGSDERQVMPDERQ